MLRIAKCFLMVMSALVRIDLQPRLYAMYHEQQERTTKRGKRERTGKDVNLVCEAPLRIGYSVSGE
jgi:hypothetical protein